MAEFAPGIPSKKRVTPIPAVTRPTFWEYARQLHRTKRGKFLVRNSHSDLRLVDPIGQGHSWAVRKWPKPGQTSFAAQQPTHTRDYSLFFEGVLPSGYGAGKVSMAEKGQAEILEAGKDKVTFNVHKGKRTEEFTLVRRGGNDWLLVNHTTRKGKYPVPVGKEHYKQTPIEDLKDNPPAGIMQPKIDGAHSLVYLESGKRPRIFSYRTRAGTGEPIEYSHKMPELFHRRVPSGIGKTIIRGETFARDSKGRALAPEQVSGMLLSKTERSREQQATLGKLRLMPFDVLQYRGKNVSDLPYPARLEIVRNVIRGMGSPLLEPPHVAVTPEEKHKMLWSILAGKSKDTHEGVVVWPETAGKPLKAKIAPDHDVYIRETFQTPESKQHGWAGGFRYSHGPSSPIVGKVGAGFAHALRKEMLEHFERFRGRVAKVRATGRFPSGALKQPVYAGLHTEKGRR